MTDQTAATARRPVVVTTAVVFIYASGLVGTAVGVLILLSRYRVAEDAVLATSLLGAAVILFGLLTLAVASGVARGSRLSRLLVTIYIGVAASLHLVAIMTTDGWDGTSMVVIAVQVFVLIALWAPPGSRYLRGSATRSVGG